MVTSSDAALQAPLDYDAVVCGGVLGLFVALGLQLKGFRVCVVEKRLAVGRAQEWNTSRGEAQVRGGALTAKMFICCQTWEN